jgi:hypothetical protein
MFDRIMLFLGGTCSAIGIALQGMSLPDGAHTFGVKLAAIICTGIGAGCIAVAPSIRGTANKEPPK